MRTIFLRRSLLSIGFLSLSAFLLHTATAQLAVTGDTPFELTHIRSMQNPAYIPAETNTVLTLPVLGASYLRADMSPLKNILKRDADGVVYWDVNAIANAPVSFNIDEGNCILGIGKRIGEKDFLYVALTAKLSQRFATSKALSQNFKNGNTGSYSSNELKDPLTASALGYLDFSVAFAKGGLLSDKLSLGARLHFMHGLFYLNSKSSQLAYTSAPYTETLSYSATMEVDSYGIFKDASSTSAAKPKLVNMQEFSKAAFSRLNFGYGLDLGAIYQFSDRLSLETSAGWSGIHWGAEHALQANISSSGVVTGVEMKYNSSGKASADASSFASTETVYKSKEQNAFFRRATAFAQFTGRYDIIPNTLKLNAGVGTIVSSRADSYVSLGLTHSPLAFLSYALSYSSYLNGLKALGAGITLGKKTKWHLGVDNLFGWDLYSSSCLAIQTSLDFRF